MNKLLFLDTETAGLRGDVISIQESRSWDDLRTGVKENEIGIIYPTEILRNQDRVNIDRLQNLFEDLNDPVVTVVLFNGTFDLWKLYQLREKMIGREAVRPFRCQVLDLMLHCKWHPVLSILSANKKVVKLKNIPKKYYEKICEVVEKLLVKNLKLPVKLSKKSQNVKKSDKRSVVYSIASSGRLKEIMRLLGEKTDQIEEVLELADWEERTYLPIRKEEEEKYEELYKTNLLKLQKDARAIRYAKNDIEYLVKLYDYLGKPGPTVHDSCVSVVAYTHWFGFEIDLEKTKQLKGEIEGKLREIEKQTPFSIQSPPQRLKYIQKHIVGGDGELVKKADKKVVGELIRGNLVDDEAKGVLQGVLSYKPLFQQLAYLSAWIEAGRCYPDFRVIGTNSYRMGGTGGLSLHGLAKSGGIRGCLKACQGGDFDALEMTIAEFFYEDSLFSSAFEKGLDMHLMAACILFPDEMPEYEEAKKIKEDSSHPNHKLIKNKRQIAKTINFAIIYGATGFKLAPILGCTAEEAEKKMEESYFKAYPGIKEARDFFHASVCTADTEQWTRDSVAKMPDAVRDLTGNQVRWLKFEKNIARIFWEETDRIAKESKADNKEKSFIRSKEKGAQTEFQAIRSACLGAALGIQSAVSRSVGNFPIQSTGAYLTKKLMERLWEKFRLPMMNVHDEVLIPSGFEDKFEEVEGEVNQFIEENRKLIRFLGMAWKRMETWADKD